MTNLAGRRPGTGLLQHTGGVLRTVKEPEEVGFILLVIARVGEFRVFYDVSDDDEIVYVRAVAAPIIWPQ